MPAKKAKSKAKKKAKAKAKARAGAKTRAKAKKKATARTKTRAKSKTEPKKKAKAKVKTAAKKKTAKAKAKKKVKAKAKAKAKTRAKAKTKAKSKAKAKTKARAKGKTKARVKAKPRAKKAAPKPEAPAKPKIKGKKLTKKELEAARARIMEERTRIIRELGRIEETISDATKEKEGSNQSYSNHLADIGTDYMEQEKNFYYASQEGHYLRALDEALERIERGTYGICEMCTLRIGNIRLEAVPAARQCIKCKSESEKGSRGR